MCKVNNVIIASLIKLSHKKRYEWKESPYINLVSFYRESGKIVNEILIFTWQNSFTKKMVVSQENSYLNLEGFFYKEKGKIVNGILTSIREIFYHENSRISIRVAWIFLYWLYEWTLSKCFKVARRNFWFRCVHYAML